MPRPSGDGEPSSVVDVALPLPVFHSFTYRIDGGESPAEGTRVLVPFRGARKIGWVVGRGDSARAEQPDSLRSVLKILETRPSAPPEILRLARWMADYYATPLGLVLRSLLPSALADPGRRGGEPGIRTRKVVHVVEPAPDLLMRETVFRRAGRQRAAFEFIEASGGRRDLAALTGADSFSRSVIAGLEEKGVVRVIDEERIRDPFEGREERAPAVGQEPTPAQADVIDTLVEAIDDRGAKPFLLHGVTGSGKTLVYIRLLDEVVERRGKTAIVLVPEIALTPQTVARFRGRFGDRVAVLHSGLSDGERHDAWRLLRDGKKRIVVGARSALFAPLPDLGAIVVDEEHDGSYKQSEAPRYNARDLAVLRAKHAGAVVVLGSATPSLESWRNQMTGKFRLLSLPDRVGGGALPPVRIVDLRKLRARPDGARSDRRPGGSTILSPMLVDAVRERLGRGEQTILLLNRRGYASFIQCLACGEVMECPNCSVSLTWHRSRGRLLCHHCRHDEAAPKRCPGCGDPDISWKGLGTEQVERVVAETFPEARVARMDLDTTGGKWAHVEILDRVAKKEVDLLLGTQMIAKGLDFPSVTLVGIVNADIGLHLPDFRASERTFQLLSQVAGRAGRGPAGGEVILQTSLPDHYAVQAALRHDFVTFADRELSERRRPAYPPHLRLVNIVVSSPDQERAAKGAEVAAAWWRKARNDAVDVVGPAPCPIERLHGRWRWHFFLRGGGVRDMTAALRRFQEEIDLPPGDIRVIVDRDPVALL